MHSAAVPTLVALAIQSVLGLVVFQANPWRKPNQCFFLLSTVIGVWLACLYFSFSTTTSAEVAFYIREASAAGALILTVFNLLRVSIRQQNRRWQEILGDAWIWLIAAVAAVIFCQTKFFLEGARFSRPPGASIPFPVPVYGKEAVFYFLYFVVAGLIVIINYARDVRQTTGSNRAELAFILTGAVVAIATTFSSFSLGFFIDRSRLVGFAPFRIVFFSLIVAYGIATRKIMEAGFFLRRAISYALLAAYLLALYGLIWWLVDSAFEPLFGISTRSAAHVTAAVAVAFAMVPARGLSQSLADRLFISTRGLDFRTTMNQAVAILKSVTTLHDLLTRFGKTIAQAVDTDRVMILLPQKDVYAQCYPLPTPASQIDLPKDHALLKYLQSSGQPIVLDELHRARPTPESDRVSKHMQHLNLAVVMGIFAREQLAHNLADARNEGLPIEYAACDFNDPVQTHALLEAIGPSLSGVIHNAGVSAPTRLPGKTTESVFATVGTKVDGFLNLFEAVAGTPLKFFCNVGSLVGRMGGMIGEIDYAAANAGLIRVQQKMKVFLTHEHAEERGRF